MSVQVEKLEHNMVKLTIEVPAEKLEEAMKRSYNKQKSRISVPGFRKGKVPYAMVEKMYGPEVFYEDASDELVQSEYPAAVDECGEEIASVPTLSVVQLEKGKPFIFTAEVAVKPPVELGKYNGITVTKIDVSVTDEEVDAEVEKERENNGRLVVVEREIKDGDTVVIDFTGYCDGKEFEGGKAEGYTLNIGSHTFVDTFEEQLIGSKAGDDVEVNVTFPENYQSEELAGQPAMFKVKVQEVKEKQLPDLDDEFAMDVSEFDTLAEYKESVKKKLEDHKAEQARLTKEDEAIAKIVASSKMDVPQAMIDTQSRQMLREMEQNLAQTGISMEMYYQYTGSSQEEFLKQCNEDALTQIKNTLVIEAIANAEDIQISDEEIDDELKKTAEQYDMDPKTLLEIAGEAEKNQISRELKFKKAIDFVMENAKERAKPKSRKKAEDSDDAAEEKKPAKKTTKKSEKAEEKED
ncbi:MAG: trigger factor [Lachnospiraceae bacterium]|nr:trigger factor [Lachnospiraceae bacterium]